MALGLMDDDVLRMAFDPAVREDEDLVRQIVTDLTDPQRGQ